MKVPPSQTPASAVEPTRVSTASPERALLEALALREGQTTLARVLAQQQPGGEPVRNAIRLLLEIGGQTVAVDSEKTLEPGTLIRLQRAGNQLKLLETLTVAPRGALDRALAEKLPAQFDLQSGLKLMARLTRALNGGEPATPTPAATTPTGSGGDSPEAARIRTALEQILRVMPRQSELTAGPTAATDGPEPAIRIRQWIQDSGLFTEARLARGGDTGTGAPRDLKSQLLRLAVQLLKTDAAGAAQDLRLLRPAASPELVQQALQFPLTPFPSQAATQPLASGASPNAGELLRMLAGMINRITVNQLHSQALSSAATADGAPPPQTWLLDLPWLNPQQEPKVVQVRIERHGGEAEDAADEQEQKQHQAQWRLNLALDLDELGPVYFELALVQRRLSTRIWAQREATWRLAESAAPQLVESLTALGLEVRKPECHHGQPPQLRTRLDRRLVDEQA